MIYEARENEASLGQGDIFEQCPLVYWTATRDEADGLRLQTASSEERVIVLTQACDLRI